MERNRSKCFSLYLLNSGKRVLMATVPTKDAANSYIKLEAVYNPQRQYEMVRG